MSTLVDEVEPLSVKLDVEKVQEAFAGQPVTDNVPGSVSPPKGATDTV